MLLPALAFAEPQTVTTEKLCQELTAYQPSDDVNYEPGKDIRGHDVVPADVDNSAQIEMLETIDLAITVDQAAQLGLPTNVPYKAEAYIGAVSVKKDGSVYFNGKRISETQIQVLCKKPEEEAKPQKPEVSNCDQRSLHRSPACP